MSKAGCKMILSVQEMGFENMLRISEREKERGRDEKREDK